MSWKEEFDKKYPYAIYVKVKGEWRSHGDTAIIGGNAAYKTMNEVFNCSGIMYIEKATGKIVDKIEYPEG